MSRHSWRRLAAPTSVLLGLVAALTGVTVSAAPATAAGSSHRDLTTATSLQAQGSAVRVGPSAFRLVNGYSQAGSVYATEPVTAAGSWSTSWQVAQYGWGDGYALVLQAQSPAALGWHGSGHGYQTVTPFLGIDFDQYRYRAGISHGTGHPIDYVTAAYFNLSGTERVWVDYNGATDRLTVYRSAGSAKPTQAYLSTTVDLGQVFGSAPVYAGFAGASGAASINITVSDWSFDTDAVAPVVTVPDDLQVEAAGPNGSRVDFEASAHDATDGARPVTCDPASGERFALGATDVTCSAADSAGNTGRASFEVLVSDTTAPVVAETDDQAAEATSAQGAVVRYDAPASSDAVDGDGVATCAPASGETFALGTTEVTCSATDSAGNTGSSSFDVVVAYGWSGFRSPVRDGAYAGKAGSTVPLKLVLTGASSGATDARGVVTVAREGGAPVPASSTNGATGMVHSDGQYHYNLSTKGMQPGRYVVDVDLGDGVARVVQLTLR